MVVALSVNGNFEFVCRQVNRPNLIAYDSMMPPDKACGSEALMK
jgi:hypothetical protein